MRLTDLCPDGTPLWTDGALVRNGDGRVWCVVGEHEEAYCGNGSEIMDTYVALAIAADDWLPHPSCPLRGVEAHPEWWDGDAWVGSGPEPRPCRYRLGQRVEHRLENWLGTVDDIYIEYAVVPDGDDVTPEDTEYVGEGELLSVDKEPDCASG